MTDAIGSTVQDDHGRTTLPRTNAPNPPFRRSANTTALRRIANADDPTADRALTPGDAAEWLHQHLGGRKRKPAAIRKLMRSGLGGVVLRSFHYGRELRTTEADLKRFVQEIRTQTERPAPDLAHAARVEPIAQSQMNDPADELVAARSGFSAGRRSTPQPPESSVEQIHLFPPASPSPS